MFRAPDFLAYISVLIAIAMTVSTIIYFGSKSVPSALRSPPPINAMVYYLNVALALFSTGAHFIPIRAHIYSSLHGYEYVPPVQFPFLSSDVLCTNNPDVLRLIFVLFGHDDRLAAPASQIITLVLAFLTICDSIMILQMSKIDPVKLTSLDRRLTLLLQAARAHTDQPATIDLDYGGEVKDHAGLEEPGTVVVPLAPSAARRVFVDSANPVAPPALHVHRGSKKQLGLMVITIPERYPGVRLVRTSSRLVGSGTGGRL
ncbi:hypothetical protein J3R83DRAFT_3746 [Lanmaoa asiatica]|nr:hypothetical protein J3R83DRAFT_3746 [Lanmaoa asiatica]